MDIQIDNVPMIDSPPPAPQAQEPAQRARQADAPEIDTSKPVPMPTIEEDPRTAMAASARRGRNQRILTEVMGDPGTREITAAFDETAGGDQPLEMPPPRNVHEFDQQEETGQGNAPEGVELTVYGQKVVVDRAEVEARGGVVEAQKQMAAEVQFRRNSEMLREAEEKLARAEAIQRANQLISDELRNKLHPSSAAPTAGTALPGSPDAAVGSEESPGRRIVEQIFAGDMDSAAQALDSLLKPESLGKVVDQTLTQREQQRREQQERDAKAKQVADVNRLMATKHADILANPALTAHARTEFELMRNKPENAGFSLAEIADVAAQVVKDKFVGGSRAQPVAAQDPMSERRDLKRSMSFTPSMGRAPVAPAVPEQTRSTVVQRMREARGLPN